MGWRDLVLDQCRFGVSYRKPTVLRCWGWYPSELARRCSKGVVRWTCGNQEHTRLEFGGSSTTEAAAYPPELCREWAAAVAEHLATRTADSSARDRAVPQETGRVRRHSARGIDPDSQREAKALEDEAAWAGTRNAWRLQRVWPQLWTGLAAVSDLLYRAVRPTPALQNFTSACGKHPERAPPTEQDVGPVRTQIALELGCPPQSTESGRACSPWHAGLIEAVQRATGDRDSAIVSGCGVAPPWA